VANLIGSWIAYAVGYYGRLELLERYKLFHVKPEHLARTEAWFERWGSWAVFFGRMVPLVRTFVSYPAGISRMPIGRFLLFTTLGSIPWNAALIVAGLIVGENYRQIEEALKPWEYLIYVAVLLIVGYFLARWILGKRRRGRAADVA
jgi:membrane protein DedA with SNARE-associated domain